MDRDDWHGTTYGYRYQRCKCNPCRQAHADDLRRYRDGDGGEKERRHRRARTRALSLLAQRYPHDYEILYAQEIERT